MAPPTIHLQQSGLFVVEYQMNINFMPMPNSPLRCNTLLYKTPLARNGTLIVSLAFLIAVTLLAGCDGQQGNKRTSSSKDSRTLTSANDSVRDIGLTLPVLDALFFEEGFEGELKSKLSLTDAQVQQLKVAASNSVADLSEDGTDYFGSARAAKKNSEEKIKNILGNS
jgi:hypothetical protein